MESIRISFIKDEIKKALNNEERWRSYRLSLEQLLANASKTTTSDHKQTSKETPTIKSNNQPTRAKQIGDALITIMCYGGDWRFVDMRKRAEETLGSKVPESTLRYVLKRDDRFDRASEGFYCLTQKGLEEARQYQTEEQVT